MKPAAGKPPRNPGPSWGFAFLRRADAILPPFLFTAGYALGTAIAVLVMPEERRNSRAYLEIVRGRRVGYLEICRHFYAFAQTLMLMLRIAEGRPYRCVSGPTCGPFLALMGSDRPALLGTFHLGHSDLLGFSLGQFCRHVYMVRLRVENSPDLDFIARRLGGSLTFVWVDANEPILLALKDALQSNASIAMKCDRPGHSSKLEPFRFFGAQRLFPFTIYHLALIFNRPVVLSASVPHAPGESLVHGSAVFEPDAGSKASNLARARVHFQDFLGQVEILLRNDPYLWFNFTPLNPSVPATSASSPPV